jgi:3-hydroxyisobutyrate dehydrogenase-like beta-hydroxyacid dehydrogenase
MKVGFIGLGQMGRHMAASVIRGGRDLVAFDLRPEARDDELLAAASWAGSARGVAEQSEIVITSLPAPPQVEAAVYGPEGVLAGLRPGSWYVDMSTSTPNQIREIAAKAEKQGIGVLDAPVAGGIRGARLGTLTVMVGGPTDVYEACLPVLATIGRQIIHVGGTGAGHAAKLVNNMMSIVNGLTAMEAMVVGVKAGLDPNKLLEVVEAGTGASDALRIIRYVVLRGNFDPAKFALALAAKDLRLAVEYAEELGVPVHVVSGASEALSNAERSGLADLDWSSYITPIETAAEVEVRG